MQWQRLWPAQRPSSTNASLHEQQESAAGSRKWLGTASASGGQGFRLRQHLHSSRKQVHQAHGALYISCAPCKTDWPQIVAASWCTPFPCCGGLCAWLPWLEVAPAAGGPPAPLPARGAAPGTAPGCCCAAPAAPVAASQPEGQTGRVSPQLILSASLQATARGHPDQPRHPARLCSACVRVTLLPSSTTMADLALKAQC